MKSAAYFQLRRPHCAPSSSKMFNILGRFRLLENFAGPGIDAGTTDDELLVPTNLLVVVSMKNQYYPSYIWRKILLPPFSKDASGDHASSRSTQGSTEKCNGINPDCASKGKELVLFFSGIPESLFPTGNKRTSENRV